jgi:uncharacterized membrane protein
MDDLKPEAPPFFLAFIHAKFGTLFRWGVIACFLLLAVGIILSVGGDKQSYSSLNANVSRAMGGELVQEHGVPRRWDEVVNLPLNSNSVLLAGIALLILLPLVRMFVAFFYFLAEEDYLYAAFTVMVVLGVAFSFSYSLSLLQPR